MRSVKFCALGVAVLLMSACLNTSTLIRVAPDGSGTVEQTLMFNLKAVESAFAGMGFKPTGKSSSKSGPTMDEAAMKAAAGALGRGVSLVSVTPVKQPSGYEGVTVRYRFDDITALDTADLMMPAAAKEMAPGGVDDKSTSDRVRFALQRNPGGSSILTATFSDIDKPTGGPKSNTSGGPGMDDPQVRQLVATLFKGFRIGMDLEVIGQVVRTDADHVNGKRITLLELNMEELLLNADKIDSLDKILDPGASLADMRLHLNKVNGLKINKPVVTVEFR